MSGSKQLSESTDVRDDPHCPRELEAGLDVCVHSIHRPAATHRFAFVVSAR